MNFFCSKDCPDLCGMDIHNEENMISYRAQPQLWSSPGFICAKFKDFATREINNGLLILPRAKSTTVCSHGR